MTAEQHRVLHALFCLSRDTRRISASTLADHAGMTATQAAAVLVELEHADLVDASRARLTMRGLATAMQLGPASHGGPLATPRLRIAANFPKSEPLAAASREHSSAEEARA